MNICIISPMYPTKDGKGGYFFVEQLVSRFASMGHRCYVIAPVNITSRYFIVKPYGCYHEIQLIDDKDVIEIYRPRYYGRDVYIMGVQWGAYCGQRAIERLIKSKKLHIDVFYAHFFRSATLVWRYANSKHIPLFVATGESTIPAIAKPCLSFTIEQFRNYLTGVICVSTKNKEEAISMNYALPEKCVVLPNGVDLNLFKPLNKEECRRKLGINMKDFVVICVGNIVKRKGQDRLVKAVEQMGNPHIKIILAGRGDLLGKSQHVIYQGFIEHDKLPQYLCASDLYVIPTRWEGCCNSIVEAMACGLPVISSNRSFNWDILNDENSILVDPDNIDEISSAIERIFKDDKLKHTLEKRSLDGSQSLSIEKRAIKILDFITSRIS